jgi:precorrin-6A/cobalt-precorrin-6A reductase
LAEERPRLLRYAICVLVCKPSGGAETEAKLPAARKLNLPVVMVRRPYPEPGCAAKTIEAALAWLTPAQPDATRLS